MQPSLTLQCSTNLTTDCAHRVQSMLPSFLSHSCDNAQVVHTVPELTVQEEGNLTMAEKHSAHRTQWAAQFGVASELCKRGYQVALTMGNHPVVDLMVVSPKGKQFSIDVKGLYKRNFWVVNPKNERA